MIAMDLTPPRQGDMENGGSSSPNAPRVRDRKNFGRVLVEKTVWISDGPMVHDFAVTKAVVTEYPDKAKAKVTVSGPSNGYQPRSATFNLRNYRNAKCPHWLLLLLREGEAYLGEVDE
jgi:hypothetical protein